MPGNALSIVQKFFPAVTQVRDAKEQIVVEVTRADNNSAKVKNHQACAMAVACKRSQHADGVIVSVSKAYVIQGQTAYRFDLPESVAREVVSFDRDAGFDPGVYTMNPPKPSQKLGAITGSHARGDSGERKGEKIKRKHQTGGIRSVLGSREAVGAGKGKVKAA